MTVRFDSETEFRDFLEVGALENDACKNAREANASRIRFDARDRIRRTI
jgi:hypothetical protein